MNDPANTEKIDGRRERTKRTRMAILAALTELLDKGAIEPTAAEIADRAGVAVRSIGQHFASREELLLAVAEHHAARLRPAPRIAKTSSLEERLSVFVKHRAKVLEGSSAMRRAAAVVLARSPSIAEALRRVAAERRAASRELFAAEIAKAENPEATERAVALISSGRAWDSLRHDMGLGPSAAREQLAFTLRTLLGSARPKG